MKKKNYGFIMGFIGGVTIVLLYLFHMYILMPIWYGGINYGYGYTWSSELLVLIVECFLFYGFARSAAEQQFNFQSSQIDSDNPYEGVKSAAIGAAMISWLIGWIFVVVRAFIQDINGAIIFIEPISTFCSISATAFIAIGLGNLAGNGVVKKYQKIFNTNY